MCVCPLGAWRESGVSLQLGCGDLLGPHAQSSTGYGRLDDAPPAYGRFFVPTGPEQSCSGYLACFLDGDAITLPADPSGWNPLQHFGCSHRRMLTGHRFAQYLLLGCMTVVSSFSGCLGLGPYFGGLVYVFVFSVLFRVVWFLRWGVWWWSLFGAGLSHWTGG